MIPNTWKADRSIQTSNQGSILVSSSVQMFEECSFQCSICVLIVCCSYLLEFSVQASECLQCLNPRMVPVQTPRCQLLSSRWLPSCIQISSTLSNEAKVHRPANKHACAEISVVRLTRHVAVSLDDLIREGQLIRHRNAGGEGWEGQFEHEGFGFSAEKEE